MSKQVVLLIASSGFQRQEYKDTKQEIEAAGFHVLTASDRRGRAVDHMGEALEVDFSIEALQPDEYDGVFLIGGSGALKCLDNDQTYRVLNEIFALDKPYGAICIAPRILAKAGVLHKKNATCWDEDGMTPAVFEQYEVVHVKNHVVVDGNVITADGPHAACEFGKAIVGLLK